MRGRRTKKGRRRNAIQVDPGVVECRIPVGKADRAGDILNHFLIQVAVAEVKRPLRNRLGSDM
jgi:hypothetical protein